MELNFLTYAIVIGVAFIGGFISSIAGSGGLLTLPALLWVGLPPLIALGTYKIQSSIGALSSAWNFYNKGFLKVQPLVKPLMLTLLGSGLGALTVQSLDGEFLRRLIPLLLIVIATFFLFSPQIVTKNSVAKLSVNVFSCTAALGVGFYGGFFGPGIGSIMPFLFVWLLGYDLVKATADTKLMSLTINGASAIIFVVNGLILWELALPMALAQVIGARFGSNLVMSKGASLVQPFLIVMTLLVAMKLFFFS